MSVPERKTKNRFDVIVIGAGFGGPVAAKKCADAGLKTLIIERSQNVGDKVISGLTIPFYGFLFGPAFIRDGNPPIERPADGIINYIIKDIEKGDIEIDETLKIPKPFSPIFAFGYNAYCKKFCKWEARQAINSGAKLRTGVTVVDFIKKNGCIKGVVTETGEKIYSKIVINSEGSQGLLAIKSGVRKKYPPDTISLADIYDYEMPKSEIDRIFGFSIRFCWGWDEQKIAPPLGYGNGLMVWPYRNSLHFMQDQCLGKDDGPVFNLKRSFKIYHEAITSKLPWWRDDVAPRIKLRAKMWEGFEIFVGLNKTLREMPNYTDGMLLIGDAAGLENTELCDGVPTTWFSADIAADIAIEAVIKNDPSADFLSKYNDRIKAHPIIQWAITATSRYNLRGAQKTHDIKKLRYLIHRGWGLGAFAHASTPLMQIFLEHIKNDPSIIGKWIRMYLRYYYNWHHERFEDKKKPVASSSFLSKSNKSKGVLSVSLKLMDLTLKVCSPAIKRAADFLLPFSSSANILMQKLLPLLEPIYLLLIKLLSPIAEPLSRMTVNIVINCDPLVFEDQDKKGKPQNE